MKQVESNFKNMVLTLLVVNLVASSALAFVYNVTREPKAKADLAKKIAALKSIIPEFDNDPVAENYTIPSDDGSALICYPAKKHGQLVGTAIESFSNKGYAGNIQIIVGLLPDGAIYDTVVVAHRETPGLGDKMEKNKSKFSEQFKNKNPGSFQLKVKKDGGSVDAITAATFSSRAYCDAIQNAYVAYTKAQEK